MDSEQINILKADLETKELFGPCLYVFDKVINEKREKRRLFHCFNVSTKKEYYKVELNLDVSKTFDDIFVAFKCLFSEKPF